MTETAEAPITVYGSSDDLIEVEGALEEEFTYHDRERGDLLAFSNGVVVRVYFDTDGVWRVVPIARADLLTIAQAPADDPDNYTDRATLTEPATWVVHGTAIKQYRVPERKPT
jgi:hypothetical protein